MDQGLDQLGGNVLICGHILQSLLVSFNEFNRRLNLAFDGPHSVLLHNLEFGKIQKGERGLLILELQRIATRNPGLVDKRSMVVGGLQLSPILFASGRIEMSCQIR